MQRRAAQLPRRRVHLRELGGDFRVQGASSLPGWLEAITRPAFVCWLVPLMFITTSCALNKLTKSKLNL